MNCFLSIGRLSETFLLLSSIDAFKCRCFAEIDHLSVIYGINKKAAYDFAIQCQWISEINGEIKLTEHGTGIVAAFNGKDIPTYLWRLALSDYISRCRPSWAYMIPSGRKEVFIFMSNDEKRCFMQAGLMDSVDKDTVNWWDHTAMLFRNEGQNSRGDIGRDGEWKTIAYEEARTGAKPHWESIDSNKSGYDIESIKETGSDERILIEVKSSLKSVDKAEMTITRNEWDVASCRCNSNRYYFYLWLLRERPRLAIVPASDILMHIPYDTGSGRWKEMMLPFDLFKESFKDCPITSCEGSMVKD